MPSSSIQSNNTISIYGDHVPHDQPTGPGIQSPTEELHLRNHGTPTTSSLHSGDRFPEIRNGGMPLGEPTSPLSADEQRQSLDATSIAANSHTTLETTPDIDPSTVAMDTPQNLTTGWKTVTLLIGFYVLGRLT